MGGRQFLAIRMCLPSTIILIAFFPNDQIQPKFYVFVKSTDINISSIWFVLNGAILMELRFITSHCHDDRIIFVV